VGWGADYHGAVEVFRFRSWWACDSLAFGGWRRVLSGSLLVTKYGRDGYRVKLGDGGRF